MKRSPLTRRTPLTRKPMSRRPSPRVRAFARELDAATSALVERSRGVCELSGCTKAATERHHVLPRSHGGTNALSNLLHLCSEHHAYITTHPAWAYENGWLRHSYDERELA